MTAPTVPLSPSNRGVHARRCVRHPGREAAARCPACGGFYCRECVSEHDGRYLCAECLTRLVTPKQQGGEWTTTAKRAALAVAGGLVLWIAFQTLGNALLRIPPSLHEGTIWKQAAGVDR